MCRRAVEIRSLSSSDGSKRLQGHQSSIYECAHCRECFRSSAEHFAECGRVTSRNVCSGDVHTREVIIVVHLWLQLNGNKWVNTTMCRINILKSHHRLLRYYAPSSITHKRWPVVLHPVLSLAYRIDRHACVRGDSDGRLKGGEMRHSGRERGFVRRLRELRAERNFSFRPWIFCFDPRIFWFRPPFWPHEPKNVVTDVLSDGIDST
jgi:hypothetical protein